MKIKVLFASFLVLALASSCQKDKSGESFSPLSVEQHKANLEESGLNVVDKFNAMTDMQAIHVANDFVALLNSTSTTNTDVMAVATAIGSLDDGLNSTVNLKATTVNDSSFGQTFENAAGIYTYNPATQSWDVEASTDQITYHFPTEGSTTNNATLSVTNFSYTTTTNPDVSTISSELLESVDVSLSVDNTELCLFSFNATYNADGVPSTVSESLTLGKYVLTTSVSNSNSVVSFDQSFEFDGANIISSHFENQGNIDYSSYLGSNSLDPFTETELEKTNMWVAVDNLKLEGIADWKGLQNDFSNVDPNKVNDEQSAMELMAQIINDNASVKLKYNDSNEIIAVGEAFAANYTDDLSGETYWELDFHMKFSDGSYMDDSFFGENDFTDLMTSIDNLMTEMETNYGSVN